MSESSRTTPGHAQLARQIAPTSLTSVCSSSRLYKPATLKEQKQREAKERQGKESTQKSRRKGSKPIQKSEGELGSPIYYFIDTWFVIKLMLKGVGVSFLFVRKRRQADLQQLQHGFAHVSSHALVLHQLLLQSHRLA